MTGFAADWLALREPRREVVRDLLLDALAGTIRAARDASTARLGAP